MNLFAFKIGTVPDIDGCRRLYNLHGLSDDDVAKAVFHQCRQRVGNGVLPNHLQRIVMISAALRHGEQFRVWSLGDSDSTEAELLQRFYSGIDRYAPLLVSWRGCEFDLPVIHYRSLLYSVDAARYWQYDREGAPGHLKNYGAQLQQHIDLADVLDPRAGSKAPLNEVAGLCGLPVTAGLNNDEIREHHLEGNLQAMRQSGEAEVLKTYLLYLNFLRNRGQLDKERHQQESSLVRQVLRNADAEHLRVFEKAWNDI